MKKICALLAVVMTLLCVGGTALAASHEDIKQSVARVYVEETYYVYDANTDELLLTDQSTGHGTCFAVGKKGEPVKYFVTNAHVAEPDYQFSDTLEIQDGDTTTSISVNIVVDYTYYLIFSDFESKVRAEFVSVSDRADLGLLTILQPTDLRQPASIRPFTSLSSEEDLWACGFPYIAEIENEGQYYSDYDQMVLVKGQVVSVKDHAITQSGQEIVHTIPSSGGNSGSPVVDKNGCVVGVHAFAYLDGGEHSAFKGAVSSNELIRFLKAEGVDYIAAGDRSGSVLLIGGAVLAVLIIVVVALMLTKKKRGGAKEYVLAGANGDHAGKRYTITAEPVSLGRNTVKCKIAYGKDVGGISAMHCELKAVSGGVQVTDLGSSYGTWIDGKKLTAHVPALMQPGQTLSLGSKQQTFKLCK